MNKKVNTLLFILGATLFNVIVTILCFFALSLLYTKTIMPLIPEESGSRGWGFTLIFIAAITVSFLVYRFVLKLLLKKIAIDKYFDPIFSRKK